VFTPAQDVLGVGVGHRMNEFSLRALVAEQASFEFISEEGKDAPQRLGEQKEAIFITERHRTKIPV
jgi:hypothetical protein